ncbi:hypothetical protein BH09PLA1_BH09PLA1_17320 [soil metagenome]
MNSAVSVFQHTPWWPVILLALSALAFYIASRLGAAALDRRGDHPAGAAAAHWLPIAVVTLAVLKQYPHAAISIIFGSSVACLTLVPGVTLLSAPTSLPDAILPIEAPGTNDRRAWSMVLPAAMLALLAGFRGYFTLLHGVLFLVQGLAALFVWTSTARHEPAATVDGPSMSRTGVAVAVVKLVFWIAFTLCGAFIAGLGTQDMSARFPHVSSGVVGALMIAPALVLPMIGSALSLSARGRGSAIISTSVDCVLLNLCVLLPIAIFAWPVISNWPTHGIQGLWNGQLFNSPVTPLPYSMATWRIDAVMLIVFGAALLMVSTRRWSPGRAEGAIGVLAFALYISANAGLATK